VDPNRRPIHRFGSRTGFGSRTQIFASPTHYAKSRALPLHPLIPCLFDHPSTSEISTPPHLLFHVAPQILATAALQGRAWRQLPQAHDQQRPPGALFFVNLPYSPRRRLSSPCQHERERRRRLRLRARELICKSFVEAPAPSSMRRSAVAVGARRGSRAPVWALRPPPRKCHRGRGHRAARSAEIRRGAAPLRANELRPPSPPLGGVALRSARAAPMTPFLSSGAVTPRCCSLDRAPVVPFQCARWETQKDRERTHLCVARRHQPKMRRSFAYAVGGCFGR
jgi:hypothetical protein